jgi:hypothetical protein
VGSDDNALAGPEFHSAAAEAAGITAFVDDVFH